MKFMFITNNPAIAKYAESSGVNRIFVDMETLGKDERQGHLDTHKAAHALRDVRNIRSAIQSAELMVRINPLNTNTQAEVDSVIAGGADRIMLPMFRDADDVRVFQEITDGRVPVTYLAETPKALVTVPEWTKDWVEGDQVHFGLNDLSLAMGLDFLFEILAARMLDFPANVLRRNAIEFGLGGVARPGEGLLPAYSVLGEHVRMGSSWVILSRAFHGGAQSLKDLTNNVNLPVEIESLLRIESDWREKSDRHMEENLEFLADRVYSIVDKIKMKKVLSNR